MKPTRTHPFRRMGRLGGALLAAAAVALGIGVHGAAAEDRPAPPTLRDLKNRNPSGLSITWADLTLNTLPGGLRVNVYQDGVLVAHGTTVVRDRTGDFSSGFYDAFGDVGLRPNTRYCVGLKAFVGTGDNATSVFSEESERRCIIAEGPSRDAPAAPAPAPAPAPPPRPTKPDLAITRVTGPAEVFDGVTAVYEVVLWNEGTPAKGTAQVTINAVDGLELVELVETPDGFTCEPHPFGGLSCRGSLGGVDDRLSERGALFKLQARGSGTGAASVYGIANHDGALDEVTGDNNVKVLAVTVK